jgi:hypothetical protein
LTCKLRNISTVFEELEVSIVDLTVANAVLLATRSWASKTDICVYIWHVTCRISRFQDGRSLSNYITIFLVEGIWKVHIFRHLFVCFQTSVYTLGEFHKNRNNSTVFEELVITNVERSTTFLFVWYKKKYLNFSCYLKILNCLSVYYIF